MHIPRKAMTAALCNEIHSIHFANRLFWNQKGQSRDARYEYHFRQVRLEDIRAELAVRTGKSRIGLPVIAAYVDSRIYAGSIVQKHPPRTRHADPLAL
jgi:hypothetical protein